MEISATQDLISDDIEAVDTLIEAGLASDVNLIGELSKHLIYSGGKRLRPLLVLLSAKSLGYEGINHHRLAAVIEFVHTATLLHDDVVDTSALRRGQETANVIWGNAASVLVGDFLYSRAFQLMVQVQNLRVLDVLAHATNVISEGEVKQLTHCKDPETTEEDYFAIIRAKTAMLFSAGTEVGALIATEDEKIIQSMANYGEQLGIAFQLVDDILDYTGDADTIGKNIGDDLAEGKPTLPLIYALHQSSGADKTLLENCIRHGGADQLPAVLRVIESTKAIDYTKQRAKTAHQQALTALDVLPDSPYKTALADLADFSVSRAF
ncbi:MAG: octaprenyl diphosphate synthase [marine bacterium B5-7]|nr:MAG: octaprenyl diphosphate synthase [marine bacterium B5-7]